MRMFLPPNTKSLIEPMDQGVIATIKSYYLKKIFIQLVRTRLSVKDIWRNFNIKKASDNTGDA
jgi:hypothetical protein